MKFRRSPALILLLVIPAAAHSQRLGGGASADISMARVFLALLVCIVVACLAILLIRYRLSGKLPSFLPRLQSAGARIRLIESRRISPQAEVSLIECDDTQYLLLVAAGGTLLLNERSVVQPSDGAC
jgi:flagellar biogenesis protein FliO